MRHFYEAHDPDYLHAFRSQIGHGGIPVFSGARRQRGGSILGTAFRFLSRYAFPVLKNALIPAARVAMGAHELVRDNKTSWSDALKTSVKKELGGAGLADLKRGRKRVITLDPYKIPTPRKCAKRTPRSRGEALM